MKNDRDQSIERLLRALPASSRPSADGNCPDAETLAALADDALVPNVRREVETHMADCDRCQMLTAALARAEGTGFRETAEVRTWKRRVVNWLVPAAAAATAVALWVIVPGQRTPPPEQAAPDRQVASAPPAAAPGASARLQTPVDALRDQSATAADVRPDRASPAESAPSPADDRLGRQLGRQPALKAEEALDISAATPESPAPPGRTAAPAAGSVAGDLQVSGQSARNDAERREATLQETSPVAERARSVASGPGTPTGLEARATALLEVVSPNPQVRWRIGPDTVVQRSADGGVTWAAQQTVAGAILTAGSSPAPDVCWLVGHGGLVMRTVDGGRQWQRTLFPESVDIVAVTASNALAAIVSSADGRRFQTSDGGRTWAAAPQ